MNDGLRAWARDRSIEGETLVCPVMVMWRDYATYCKAYGFDQADGIQFVRFLGSRHHVRLVERGHGNLRKVVEGMGLRPIDEEKAS